MRTISASPERPRLLHRVRLLWPHLSALRTQVAPSEDLRPRLRQREERGQTQPSIATLREALRRHHHRAKLHRLQGRPNQSSGRLHHLRKQESSPIYLLHHQAGREPHPTQPTQVLHRHHARPRHPYPTKRGQWEASSVYLRPSQATAYPRAHLHHPQAEGQFLHRLPRETRHPRLLRSHPRHRQPRHHRLSTTYHRLLRYRHLHLVLHQHLLRARHQSHHLYPQQAM